MASITQKIAMATYKYAGPSIENLGKALSGRAAKLSKGLAYKGPMGPFPGEDITALAKKTLKQTKNDSLIAKYVAKHMKPGITPDTHLGSTNIMSDFIANKRWQL